MKYANWLLLLTAAAAFQSSDYEHMRVLTSDVDFTVYWSITADQVNFAMSASTAGWLSFGLGEQTSGGMPGADIMVGWHDEDTGTGSVTDYYAMEFSTPSEDDCQDWTLVSSEYTNGITYMEMTRALDSEDGQDRVFPTESFSQRILYAWGTTDSFAYHGGNRATSSIDFSGAEADPLDDLISMDNVMTVDLLNEFTLTDDITYYHETQHDLNAAMDLTSGPVHIIAIEHILQENMIAHVHHFTGELQGDSGDSFIYAWASGTGSLVTPEACGFRVSADDNMALNIQTHYDNSIQENIGTVDNSGVRVYYTADLRQYDCGVVQLGDPAVALATGDPLIATPYQKTSFTCDGNFVPEVTFFQGILHMHEVGQRMWTEHYDSDGQLLSVIDEVEFWDEALQPKTPMDVSVSAGDSFVTTCVTEGDGSRVWGLASAEEMCIHFISYYPLNSNFQYCGYGITTSSYEKETLQESGSTWGIGCGGQGDDQGDDTNDSVIFASPSFLVFTLLSIVFV